MILDVILILAIGGITIVAAAAGLVRALVMLFVLYLLSIVLGMLVVALNLAQLLSDLVLGSLGGIHTPFFYQGLIFIALLIPAFVGAMALTNLSLGDTSIAKLKWLDNLLGTAVGIVVALVFAAVLCNAWGVIVRDQWAPYTTWLSMHTIFGTSALRPYMMIILRIYRRTLFPFALSAYPIFFIPQA